MEKELIIYSGGNRTLYYLDKKRVKKEVVDAARANAKKVIYGGYQWYELKNYSGLSGAKNFFRLVY